MPTTNSTNADTVAGMYEAFGRGDVAAILSQLSEDVEWDVTEEPWTAAGVPWLKARHGRAEVAEFFAIVGAWRYERFELLDLLVSETRVAAVLRMIAELPNGARIDEVVVHLWTFDADGVIVSLRRMLDTAMSLAAART